MIELPEALAFAAQIRKSMAGKTVERVYPPTCPHKFCWFNGNPEDYSGRLAGRTVIGAEGFGIFVEMDFGEGISFCFNDGVNPRYLKAGEARPRKYQLLLAFTDGSAMAFTVSMYGGIMVYADEVNENEYYRKSRSRLSPLSEAFTAEYFMEMISSVKPSMSMKAFLATEQRIPGLGNGCLQDILFDARIHPKRKLESLTADETAAVYHSVRKVMSAMVLEGGRDTEKDLYGNPGGYHTLLSRNTVSHPCPACGGTIVKENYLGGAVYYCPSCQKVKA